MLRSLRLLPLAVLALAACDGNSTHPENQFFTNRAVIRVQKDESGEELKLDAPLTALEVVSALDPARAFTAVLGGDFEDIDETRPSPMLELYIPGPLAERSYPVAMLDLNAAEELSPTEQSGAYGAVAAANGGKTALFTTTGGTVEVVAADDGGGRAPGHLRARLSLELREVKLDGASFGYGSQATGRGTLDGLVIRTLASDADVAFTGAYTGIVQRDLLSGVFGGFSGSSKDWFLITGPRTVDASGAGFGTLDLHLARVPGAGETLRFSPVPPETLRQRAGTPADSLSSAMLDVVGRTAGIESFVTTAGQLRVESATSGVLRGTLSLTLTEFTAGKLGTRTVTASGPVALTMGPVSPFLSRAAAVQALRTSRTRMR